jgi:hypothetical protein
MQNTISFFRSLNVILLFLSICGGSSCNRYIGENVAVKPKTFKVLIPLAEDGNGFIVNTAWGDTKAAHLLNWDNHSPTWGNDSIILNNPSVTKSNKYGYRTLTADGTSIQGDVYKCNEITFGKVSFENVLFYDIAGQAKGDKTAKTDGVFGENLISNGIWEFDFKNLELIFVSSMDSLKGVNQAMLLPSIFTDNNIELQVNFRNRITKRVEIDLGYNGDILLPEKEFEKITKGNYKTYEDSLNFSTPIHSQRTKQKVALDSISINKNIFETSFSTNPLVNDALIGRRFFRQFEFVIFDYINKAVYVSKKRIVY